MGCEYPVSIMCTFCNILLRKTRRVRRGINEPTLAVCCETECQLNVKALLVQSLCNHGAQLLDCRLFILIPMQQLYKRKHD